MKDRDDIEIRLKELVFELRSKKLKVKTWSQMEFIEDQGRTQERINHIEGSIEILQWLLKT